MMPPTGRIGIICLRCEARFSAPSPRQVDQWRALHNRYCKGFVGIAIKPEGDCS